MAIKINSFVNNLRTGIFPISDGNRIAKVYADILKDIHGSLINAMDLLLIHWLRQR